MTSRYGRLIALWALFLPMACNAPPQVPAAMGRLEWDRLELVVEANEPIVDIVVREGDTVGAGQVVLRQETIRYQALRDEAEAARAQQAARLAELRRGPRSERIAEGRARLAGAEGVLKARVNDVERIEGLVARQLISPQELDRARAERDAALAERDRARAELAELLAGTTAEELKQAQEALDRAEATLRATGITLERLTVRAPQAARVDALPYKLGERPPVGAVVAVLMTGEAPYARVYVPEPVRVHVVPGGAAEVHVDGVPQPFAGTVRKVSQEATFTPYFALTERDRSRLSYVAEVVLTGAGASKLPAGVPVQVTFPNLATR